MDGRSFAASLLRAPPSARQAPPQSRRGGAEGDRAICLEASGARVPATCRGDRRRRATALLGTTGIRLPIAAEGPNRPSRLARDRHPPLAGAAAMNSYYMLAFDDSRVVIGATRETGSASIIG